MKRTFWLAVAPALLLTGDVQGRGFGGAGRAGGGGMARPVFHGTPSFSGGQPFHANTVTRPANQVRPGHMPGVQQNFNQVNRNNFNQVNRNTFNQVNRQNINIANQPNWNTNRTNINVGGNTTNIVNTPKTNINANVNRSLNTNVNRPINANRPINVNRPIYSNRPVYGYHNWHRGYWHNWSYWPSFWAAPVAAGGWLGPATTNYVYSNPYVVESPTYIVQSPALDYSKPIAPAPQVIDVIPPDPAAPPPQLPGQPGAEKDFEAARAAFKRGDYRKAQEMDEKALSQLPSDAVLQEFRALTLFAQKQYGEAASVIYAVLAAGPGWDWQTMSELYPDTQVYTKQLRDLEQYQRDNPKAADGHFLLAYQYLVLGYQEQAVKQLQDVVKLQPDDKLSAELLKALTQKEGERPAPARS